jgi:hypothetical protein
MDIYGLTFAWTQLQIQLQLEEASLTLNWNELLNVGWERYLFIEKLRLKELALMILAFPNVPHN